MTLTASCAGSGSLSPRAVATISTHITPSVAAASGLTSTAPSERGDRRKSTSSDAGVYSFASPEGGVNCETPRRGRAERRRAVALAVAATEGGSAAAGASSPVSPPPPPPSSSACASHS
eukprot:31317-Pelagococcus_subviridis.AAC.1